MDIATDDQHDSVTEHWQRGRDPARNFQRLDFARVANAGAEFPAVAQCCFDDAAEVGDVDDDLSESGRDQALDLPHDERLAARREQRLGELVGQRTHALTTACREDHRYHEGGQAL